MGRRVFKPQAHDACPLRFVCFEGLWCKIEFSRAGEKQYVCIVYQLLLNEAPDDLIADRFESSACCFLKIRIQHTMWHHKQFYTLILFSFPGLQGRKCMILPKAMYDDRTKRTQILL